MPVINGTSGDDTIPRGNSSIDGGGNVSFTVDDTIYGFGGNDLIADGGGNNQVFGGTGNDNLTTGNGFDQIYGGAGNDFVSGGDNDDLLYGGAGDDFVWILNGDGFSSSGTDMAYGGAGNDHIQYDVTGASTGHYATGGAGTDILSIKMGGYYTNGVLDVSGYSVDLSAVWTGGQGNIAGSIIEGIESIWGIQGSAGDDSVILGTRYTASVNDLINGVLVQNQINLNDGNDYFSGGQGEEQVNGGNGNDTLIGNGGNDYMNGGAGNNLLYGGQGNDALNGANDADTLFGGSGNDNLVGSAGNDSLDGGTGNDIMYGGTGDDLYVVDSAQDVISEEGGIDTVKAGFSYALNVWPINGIIENLTLSGGANVDGTGSALANRLQGNSGANHLYGLENADILSGGAGADTLSGGMGADRLTGGTGADTFVFDVLETAANKDRIYGFEHGIDKIAFDHLIFGAFAGNAPGALDPAAFHLGQSAVTSDQHILYNSTTGILLYDADGRGGAAAVAIAVLADKPVLDASDLLLV